MAFDCNGCGACCKRVPSIVKGWPARADGACAHLTAENKCAIYETRPDICRVDKMRPKNIPVERWYALNAAACETHRKAVE